MQTAPRTELLAFAICLAHVNAESEIIVAIDCKFVVDGVQRVRQGWRPGPSTRHGDLWARVVQHAGGRLLRATIYKVKAHRAQEDAVSHGVPKLAWEANFRRTNSPTIRPKRMITMRALSSA